MSYTPGLNGGRINISLSGNSTSAGAGYALASTGTVYLAGGNNVTLSQNGQSITISGGAGGGGVAIANSQTTYTSGTANLLEGGGAITIASSAGGQSYKFSVPATSSLSATGLVSISTNGSTISIGGNAIQGAQMVSLGGVAPGGITLGTSGVISGGTLGLQAGGGIVLSQSSGTNSTNIGIHAVGFAAGLSNIGNTAGTTITNTPNHALILAGGNNITLSQSTSADIFGAVTATVTVSGPNQSVQTQNLHNLTLAGNSTSAGAGYIQVSSGTLTLAGGNNITLSQNGNAVTVSAFTQTVQTQSRFNLTLAGNSTSAGGGYAQVSSGTMTLAGGNNVTLSQNANAVTISAASQTVQTQNLHAATLAGNSTSAGAGYALVSSGTITWAGGNNITLSQNGNAVTISGGAGGGVAMYDGANSITSGTAQFDDANGVSFGFNGQTVTASANIHNLTLAGNSTSAGAGYAQVSTGTMTLAGGNNITLSQNGNAISISAPNFATAAAPFAQQLAGNSTSAGAGYSTVTSGTMQWAGGNNITLSQNGASVTISGAGSDNVIDFYQNMDRGTSASLATAHRTLMLQRLNQENNEFGHMITGNTFLLNMTANMTATSLSSSHSMSVSIGLYLDQATALSLINSASTSWGLTANTGNTSNYHGPRWLSFVSSQWSSAPNFVSGNDYVLGVIFNSSNYGPPLSYIGQNYMHSLQRSGSIGTSVATNTSMAHGNYWNAMHSATQSSMPATIASNVVNRNNATAQFMPHIIINNRYSGTF